MRPQPCQIAFKKLDSHMRCTWVPILTGSSRPRPLETYSEHLSFVVAIPPPTGVSRFPSHTYPLMYLKYWPFSIIHFFLFRCNKFTDERGTSNLKEKKFHSGTLKVAQTPSLLCEHKGSWLMGRRTFLRTSMRPLRLANAVSFPLIHILFKNNFMYFIYYRTESGPSVIT